MSTLPLSAIIIDRPARQRRELRDIPALADSIARVGLIHPPVVTRENVLVAGERRVTAMKSLGWASCPVTFTDELQPDVLAIIELEENIRRDDLPWQDEVKALRDYHNLRAASEDGWSRQQTADALGTVRQRIDQAIDISRELDRGNPLVVEAQSFSVARGLVERNNQRREAEESFRLKAAIAEPSKPTGLPVAREPSASTTPVPTPKEPESPIQQGDFHEFARTYNETPFNFLHCDFPYGVDAGSRKQGTSTLKHGGYSDSPDVYWNLLDTLATNLDRLVAPSAHLMFWFSMDYYAETLRFFANRTDLVVQPFPLYWFKTDNTGLLPDPKRGPRRVVETALLASRGDRHIVQAVANCFGHPTIRDDHMSIKPESMLQHFFRMFVDEHTRFLDPTCGSGASVIAARNAGAAIYRGLELSTDFAGRAQRRFAASKGGTGSSVAELAEP